MIASDIVSLVSIDNKYTDLEPVIELKNDLKAPISKGDIVGTISYDLEGLQYTTDLLAGNDIEEFKPNYAWIYILVIFLVLTLIILGIRFYNHRKKYFRNRTKYIIK